MIPELVVAFWEDEDVVGLGGATEDDVDVLLEVSKCWS